MIKIQRLLVPRCRERQIAVQTDNLLPKITIFNRKQYHKSQNQNNSMVNNGKRHYDLKESNSDSDEKIDKPSLTKLFNKNNQLKLRTCMKQNTNFSMQTPKIQANKFKFLQFQQNNIRRTLQNYLGRKPLSKEQLTKINQQISIVLISDSQQPQHCDSRIDNEWINIGMSEAIKKKKKIKQIANKIKQIYIYHQSIGRINSLTDFERTKKLIWIIQSLVLKKKSLQIKSNEKEINLALNLFLQEYILSCQQYQPVKVDQNKLLLNFYTQVFNKYDQIPFSQEFNDLPLNLSRMTSDSIKLKTMILQKNGKRSRFKDGGSQFIKCISSESLRNEVKNMANDTQKILSEETNKLTQV